MHLNPLLLSLAALASTNLLAAASSKTWLITDLKATDAPVDPAQTGVTPALHSLQFNVEDEQSPGLSRCSAAWVDNYYPRSLARCDKIAGNENINATFSWAVDSYNSASTGFKADVEEFFLLVDVGFIYNASVVESSGENGGACTYTPLQNAPDVTFASCAWPPFDLYPVQVSPPPFGR